MLLNSGLRFPSLETIIYHNMEFSEFYQGTEEIDLISEFERRGGISKTLYGKEIGYTIEEFSSDELEYPHLLEYLPREVEFLKASESFRNLGSAEQEAFDFVLTAKKKELEGLTMDHQSLSLQRKDIALSQRSDYMDMLSSSNYGGIETMHINSYNTESIDRKQDELLDTYRVQKREEFLITSFSRKFECTESRMKLQQSLSILSKSNPSLEQAAIMIAHSLDKRCISCLKQMSIKHRNTREAILEKVRKVRTERLAERSLASENNACCAFLLACIVHSPNFEDHPNYDVILEMFRFVAWLCYTRRLLLE